jgi:CHAD domain-containing protein
MIKKRKPGPAVRVEQTVSEAYQAILDHNFRDVLKWADTARNWDDIEGVHKVRVAFRRIRSAFSAFQRAIPKKATEHWSQETRWLAGELGMARDLDVFIDEGLGSIKGVLPLPGEEKLLELAKCRRAEAYEQVNAMLDSERFAQFKAEFPEWVKKRGWEQPPLSAKKQARMSKEVLPFSRKLLDRLERRVLEAGSHVDKTSAEEMHRLRIECKKLRYGAEFFVPIIKGLDDFIGHMKGLQDLLGVMNDVSVMKHLLEHILADETDPEVLQYAGGLVGWRTRHYHELLNSFEERWEEFVNAKHPWWTKPETE